MSDKTRYWRISSNGELSATVPDLTTAMELIEADFEGYDEAEQGGTWYKITAVWMHTEEYESLPEM